jgi:hypothetical protein
MEYISLVNLQNTYQSPQGYDKKDEDEFRLTGIYPQNVLDFPIPDISNIIPVNNTSFRFIIALKTNPIDDDLIGYYTSVQFYNDLVVSINENNPYFINSAVRTEFLVDMYVDNLLGIHNKQTVLEKEIGVEMRLNLFYNQDGIPDYEKLVEYIDWLVSPSKLEEIEDSGVLPVSELSDYSLGKYNYDTNQWGRVDIVNKEIKIVDIKNEISQIDVSIALIQDFIRNPTDTKLRAGSYLARTIGLSGITSLVTSGPFIVFNLAKSIFNGVKSFQNAKNERERDILNYLNKLKIELNRLRERKIILNEELRKLEG